MSNALASVPPDSFHLGSRGVDPRQVLFIGNAFNLDEAVEASLPFSSLGDAASSLCSPRILRAKSCEALEQIVFQAERHKAGKKKTYPDYLGYLSVEALMNASGLPIVKKPGGSPANTAQMVAKLARAGTKVKLLGNVGNDEDGQTLLDDFHACGIEVATIASQACSRTLRNLVLFDLVHHDRRIVKDSYAYNDSQLRKFRVAHSGEGTYVDVFSKIEKTTLEALLEKTDFVVLLCQMAGKDPATVRSTLDYCIEHKKSFALSPPTEEGFDQGIKDKVIASLPYADLFLCNTEELSELYDDADIQACMRRVQQSFQEAAANPAIAKDTYLGGVQAAHITDGHDRGETIKYIVTKDSITEVRTPASKTLVNNLGAGDAYAGAIIAMLDYGFSHHDAAIIASLVSMCTVEQPHAVVEHPIEAVRGKMQQLSETTEVVAGLSEDVRKLFGYVSSGAVPGAGLQLKQLRA